MCQFFFQPKCNSNTIINHMDCSISGLIPHSFALWYTYATVHTQVKLSVNFHTTSIMPEWSNGLCGCFNSPSLCILTFFCPCVTAGRVAEKMGMNCCLYGCLTLLGPVGVFTRTKVRVMIRVTRAIEVGCGQGPPIANIVESKFGRLDRYRANVGPTLCHVQPVMIWW